MKNRYITIVFLFVLFLSACEFESYEDFGIKPYDGALTFTEISPKAAWKNRFDHAAVAFKDRIYIMGGYNPGATKGDTYYEDVWSSADGITWQLETDSAAWLGRRGHSVVVFDDGNGEAIYLLGGFSVNEATGYRQYCNDVWKSEDGRDWVKIKERTYPKLNSEDTWFPRMNHTAVVANHGGNNYIYIIGGRTQLENHSGTYAQEYFNDVWRSQDGINWERLDNDDYGMRASHAAAVDPSTGTIYIQGGRSGIIFDADSNYYQPVANFHWLWSSPDGISWTAQYDSIVPAYYLSRIEHEMVFYEGKLWVFPGSTNSNMHYHLAQSNHYPTWTFDDGIWAVDSEGSDLRGRHSYGMAVMNDKIWFLGGFTSNKGQENDVWTAEF